MITQVITVREFICQDVCPGWDRVDIRCDAGCWRIAKDIHNQGHDLFTVVCYNGDVFFDVPGSTPVVDWRTRGPLMKGDH